MMQKQQNGQGELETSLKKIKMMAAETRKIFLGFQRRFSGNFHNKIITMPDQDFGAKK